MTKKHYLRSFDATIIGVTMFIDSRLPITAYFLPVLQNLTELRFVQKLIYHHHFKIGICLTFQTTETSFKERFRIINWNDY